MNKHTYDELKSYTNKYLKEMCKEKGLRGYSRANKEELVYMIENNWSYADLMKEGMKRLHQLLEGF